MYFMIIIWTLYLFCLIHIYIYTYSFVPTLLVDLDGRNHRQAYEKDYESVAGRNIKVFRDFSDSIGSFEDYAVDLIKEKFINYLELERRND